MLEQMAGVFAPVCTPFGEDEEVDYGALRSNLEFYARTEILGYLALG